MAKITVLSPPTVVAEYYHVHRSNCPDIKRKYRGVDPGWTAEVSSIQEIVEEVYGDQIRESDQSWRDYASDVRVFPCVIVPEVVHGADPQPPAVREHPVPAKDDILARESEILRLREQYDRQVDEYVAAENEYEALIAKHRQEELEARQILDGLTEERRSVLDAWVRAEGGHH
jgi:hypothetical protein